MKFPSEVYVIGHKYDIQELSEEMFEGMDTYGDCCNHKRLIRVYLGGGGSTARDTLLHEILHAIWHLMAFEKHEEEERVVNSTSTALISIIDDPRNRQVIDFIYGKQTTAN